MKGFIILLLYLVSVSGHPQCLDFKPPFESEISLGFCPQYSSFGCCTTVDDSDLKKNFNAIKPLIPRSKWNKCKKDVHDLLCLKCSPYAAHVFDAEGSLTDRGFPGLCNTFCQTFFSQCKELIPYITTRNINMTSSSAASFCQQSQLIDQDYCFPDLLTNNILNNRVSIQTVTQEGCICVEEVARGLKTPVFVTNAADGSNRLFVGELNGIVRVHYPNGSVILDPFLDIKRQTFNTKADGDERGFLGMTFHPKFKQNQKFYIYYSTQTLFKSEFTNHIIRISEMMVSRNDANKANVTSERVLIEIEEPYWNHNGGEVSFLKVLHHFCTETETSRK